MHQRESVISVVTRYQKYRRITNYFIMILMWIVIMASVRTFTLV
jgi:hypothetical protein